MRAGTAGWAAALAGLGLAGCRSAIVALPDAEEPRAVVGQIRLATSDVFTAEEASGRPLYLLVNALHSTSREALLERILWIDEGDLVTEDVARELERELRRTGLFSEANVELVETAPGEVDLSVETRDRFSLIFGAGGFLVGGVGGVDAQFGENNLFGLGDRLQLSFASNSEDEERAELRYTDRHFLTEEHRATVLLADSEEGFEGTLGVEKRLRHLEDDGRWSAFVSTSEVRVDYFEGGNSVAEVPRESQRVALSGSLVSGPRDRRVELGLRARLVDERFGAAIGPQAGSIDVPGDVLRASAAAFGSLRSIGEFRRTRGLDALGFVEDLELGHRLSGSLGTQWRDEQGLDATLVPTASVGAGTLFEPFARTLISAETSGALRWNAGEALGWSASAALRAYTRLTTHQVLAVSAVVEAVFEGEGLPVELTLGDDNGLRGFPAREFSGDRRARINLEHRIDTGLQLGSFRFGLTPFADCAWIDDSGFGEPLVAAGIGLRIGSEEFFGGGVIRIDLGVPLVEPDGRNFEPSLSIALGQVFTLFGNAAALSSN